MQLRITLESLSHYDDTYINNWNINVNLDMDRVKWLKKQR